MKKLFNLIGLALSLAFLSLGLGAPAFAATVFPYVGYIPNVKLDGALTATGGYTNSTTTPTVIPGTLLTIPYTNSDVTKQFIRVCYSGDVTKATSTTGTISIYAAVGGGALANVNAAFDRYVASSAGRNTVGGCFVFARPAQTFGQSLSLALYGVSGDTAAFTVTNLSVEYWRITQGG